jgi:MFS family permease
MKADAKASGDQPSSFFQKVKSMGQGAQNNGPAGDVSPAEKRKTIIALLLALGILQTLYMNLTAFFPNYAGNYYYWVDEGKVGFVLAMFQVAYLLMAPIVGINLQRVGRKNMILMGYTLCIIATVCFGLCSHLPENCNPLLAPNDKKREGHCLDTEPDPNLSRSKTFFGLSLAVRFIQGVGDSMVATASYSIVSIEFPNEREVYIGYC